jgi:signal transduction histidine kinase
MVLSREEERRRMGRDLHDDLGPQLAAISMQVETVRDVVLTDPERAHSLLGELLDQAEKAVHETRRVAHAHRPPGLDAVGLVPALESHLAQVTTLPTRFDVPQRLPDLPAAVEAAAYRIAVEAVQNVAAHARARSCSVRLTHTRQELILEVADDGIGMAPNHSIGLGLDSMTERAAELGGRLTVEAGAEEIGTVVRAVLPCRGTDVTRLASRGAPPGRTEGKAHPDEHAERADLRRPRRVSSQPVGADQRR